MSVVSTPVPVKGPEPVAPRTAPPKSGGGKPWIWLILLVIAGGGAWYSLRPKGQPAVSQSTSEAPVVAARTAKVFKGNLERTVRVTGQTGAINFSNVIAPILRGPDGNRDLVLITLAPSGSYVKKGQVIAVIDGQSMQDHVDDLKDTIEAAEADIQKRGAEQDVEYENLQQTIRIVKSEVDKARLDVKGGEMKSDVEKQLLKLNLDEAEARYKQQIADLDNKKKVHQATLRILEYTKDRHVRHRERHLNDLKKFTIHAAMDGLVVMTSIFRGSEMGQVQQGDRVYPGQLFMKVVDTSKMHVEASINQVESSDFRVGQEAKINLDAFPGLTFPGKVHSIGALAVGGWRSNYFIRNIPVLVRIQGNDPRLIPDLSSGADVVLERAENKTIAPLAAFSTEKGRQVAYVKKAETWEQRTVELGLKNDNHAVVLSGLNPGEEVRLN
jgi:HlyD family secretion protein